MMNVVLLSLDILKCCYAEFDIVNVVILSVMANLKDFLLSSTSFHMSVFVLLLPFKVER
jgi:hypothetical protein